MALLLLQVIIQIFLLLTSNLGRTHILKFLFESPELLTDCGVRHTQFLSHSWDVQLQKLRIVVSQHPAVNVDRRHLQ